MLVCNTAGLLVNIEDLLRRVRVERMYALAEGRRERLGVVLRVVTMSSEQVSLRQER